MREEEERKLNEEKIMLEKYKESLKNQVVITKERRRAQQLMTDDERRLNNDYIEAYRTQDAGVDRNFIDPFQYSRGRAPSNYQFKPVEHKEMILKDLNNFKGLMNDPEKVKLQFSTIDAPQSRIKNKYLNNQIPHNLSTELPKINKMPDYGTPSAGYLKNSGEKNLFEFAQPIFNHKFVKRRVLTKRSHLF